MWKVTHVGSYSNAEPATKAISIVSSPSQMLVLALGSGDKRDRNINVATFDGIDLTRPAGLPISYDPTNGIASLDVKYIDISGKATGTYNLYYEVTTGTPDGGGFAVFLIEGINKFDLIEDTDQHTGNGGNAGGNLTTAKPNCLLFDIFFSDRNADLTAGSGQTQIFQYDPPGDGNTDRMGASYKVVNGAGNYSMYWTGSSEEWAHFCMALNPSNDGGAMLLSLL